MITLKIIKTILPTCDINSNFSSIIGKLITLGLFFVENENENWIVRIFKEKITLKP